MLVDMHLHECTYSTDSFLHLEEIVSIARQKGLDAICITDHDSMGLRERAEAYSREIGYPIFVGVEFFSLWGDITAWGIDGIPDQRVSAQDFIDLVREKDGFCVSCHPFRSNNRGLREHLRDVHGLDGVEVLNGSTPLEENRTALRFCRELGLKAIGASDAHVPEQVGKYVTWLPETVTTLPDFVTRCTRWKRVPPSGRAAGTMSSPSFEMNFQRAGVSCSGLFFTFRRVISDIHAGKLW